jgi:polyhydroxyalkanoate synthesis regulator phasin
MYGVPAGSPARRRRQRDAGTDGTGKELPVTDLIGKTLLRGLGLANLTKNAIMKTVDGVAAKSSLSEDEGRRMVKDLKRRSTKAQKRMEKTVGTAVNRLLKDLNLTIARTPSKPAKRAKAAGTATRSRRRRGGAGKARSR